MPDFASSTSTLSDAFLDLGLSDRAHIRFGRDKTPSGFETLLGDANVLFMERGLTLNLVPGRDMGVQLYGDLAGGNTSYVVGIFHGTVDGSQAPNLDTANGKELVARGVVHLFLSAKTPLLEKLGVGFGGSREDQEGPLPSWRTVSIRGCHRRSSTTTRASASTPSTPGRVRPCGRELSPHPRPTRLGRWRAPTS